MVECGALDGVAVRSCMEVEDGCTGAADPAGVMTSLILCDMEAPLLCCLEPLCLCGCGGGGGEY